MADVICKTVNGWTINNCTAYLAADGVTLTDSYRKPLLVMTADQAAAIKAEFDETAAKRSEARRVASAPKARKSSSYTAKGFDGRGGRQGGPEWLWK